MSGHMPGRQRPWPVTLLAIFLSAYGLLTLVPKLLLLGSLDEPNAGMQWLAELAAAGPVPLPVEVHLVHGIVGSLVWIATGVGLWKGRNWSRWLVAGWGITVLFMTFAVYGVSASFPWKAGILLILIAYLYLSGAKRFFQGDSTVDHG